MTELLALTLYGISCVVCATIGYVIGKARGEIDGLRGRVDKHGGE